MALRIAILVDIALKKLGSFEAWLVAFAGTARERGDTLAVYSRDPTHPTVLAELRSHGVVLCNLDEIENHPLASIRAIARSHDVVQLHFMPSRGRIALIARAAWPSRVLLVEHLPEDGPNSRSLRGWVSRRLDAVTPFRIRGVATVSEYVRRLSVARFPRAASRTRTIYNGIDTHRYAPPAQRTAGPLRLLSVASLIPEKGVETLLRAYAAAGVPGRLAIAGAGPDHAALVELSRQLAIDDRVEFLGLRDDVPALLQDADIFVHPAVCQEAFGFTVAEAMAAGCAVIATQVGGIPEIIENGRSGVLVPPGDTTALAEALRRLAGNSAERARLGQGARDRIVGHFALQHTVREYLDWCDAAARA